MMVFNAIGFWLLVLAIPLWTYRWYLFGTLEGRERSVARRLIKQRHERALGFFTRTFLFLIAVSASVMVMVFGLGYLKNGAVQIGSYREVIRSRLYSGMDPVDQALDTFHYDQTLPVAILSTCLLLSIAFTLVAAALRDISVFKRLKQRIGNLVRDKAEPAS